MNKKKNDKSPRTAFVPGYMDAELTPDALMDLFSKKGQRKNYSLQELQTIFGAGKGRKRDLEDALSALVGEGRLIRLKGPAYTLPEGLKSLRGHIKIQRQGMGFVRPLTSDGEDVYVHPTQLNGAWDGDLVLVGLLPGKSGKSREGRVLEVLERRVRELLVELLPQGVKEDGLVKRLAKPMDSRMQGYLLVDLEGLPEKARPGDLVLAAIDESETARQHNKDGVIRALAVTAFGSKESLAMYERLVKAEHGIPTEFPAAALAELKGLPEDPDPRAALLPEGDAAEWADAPLRRDLRDIDFVTIDGADARDFDDAICVRPTGKGYTLWVAIADVAYYVKPGSAVDKEALERGNSYYFPASVEPMLPHELSNGLCSLKPDVPRLAVVAEMQFSAKGIPGKAKFYRALIQSRKRLTYEIAQAILDGTAKGKDLEPEQIPGMLRDAQKLATELMQRRKDRGTLDFDLPEAKAEVDKQGRVIALSLRERLFTHKLIEEFMIAANEAVARHLAGFAEQGLAFLYRAHPAPDGDKLADLARVLEQAGLGASLPENPGIGDLQKLLQSVKGAEREYVVNRLVLRSMMQAAYSPIPEGHFGLASEAYSHFTSPIRRYADLTLHRALLHIMGYPGKIPGHGALAQIADELNGREREGVDAEREIFKICAALYLEDYVGEEFEAVISGLSAFGLFVELTEPPCEGFVRMESLPDDYYQFDHDRQLLLGQRSGKRFSLGQALSVTLVKSDPLRQEITFELTDVRAASERTRGQSGRQSASKSTSKSSAKKQTRPQSKSSQPGKKKRQSLPKGSVRRRG